MQSPCLHPLLSPSTFASHLWHPQTSPVTYRVKFHSYQSLVKQSVRQVKGRRQSASFSEGDKAGNSGQYWHSLCTDILPTGRPEADNTRTADFSGPFISPYTTKSINESRKDSDDFWSEENFSQTTWKVSEEEERVNRLYPPDKFFFFKGILVTCWRIALRRRLSQCRRRHLFLTANVRSSSCWLW